MRLWLGVLMCLVATVAYARPASLYERLAAKLAHDPALAEKIGRPAAELGQVQWMIGDWDIAAKVFATKSAPESVSHGRATIAPTLGGTWLSMTDRYESEEPQDVGYLSYSVASKTWISVGIDATGNAVVTTAAKWDGNRLVFSAPFVEIVGERVTLRQTMEKISDREYRILNEERLSDGTWIALDEYRYTKR